MQKEKTITMTMKERAELIKEAYGRGFAGGAVSVVIVVIILVIIFS